MATNCRYSIDPSLPLPRTPIRSPLPEGADPYARGSQCISVLQAAPARGRAPRERTTLLLARIPGARAVPSRPRPGVRQVDVTAQWPRCESWNRRTARFPGGTA